MVGSQDQKNPRASNPNGKGGDMPSYYDGQPNGAFDRRPALPSMRGGSIRSLAVWGLLARSWRRLPVHRGDVVVDVDGRLENSEQARQSHIFGVASKSDRVLREAGSAVRTATTCPIVRIPQPLGAEGGGFEGSVRIRADRGEDRVELVEEADLRGVEKVRHILGALCRAQGHGQHGDLRPRGVKTA